MMGRYRREPAKSRCSVGVMGLVAEEKHLISTMSSP